MPQVELLEHARHLISVQPNAVASWALVQTPFRVCDGLKGHCAFGAVTIFLRFHDMQLRFHSECPKVGIFQAN